MSWSEHDANGIPRSSDAGVRWAADTDPVGPVTPELALVDPGLAHDVTREVSMSTAEFGDGTTFGPPAVQSLPAEGLLHQPTVPAAVEPLAAPTLQPLAPLPPLAPPAAEVQPTAPPVAATETPAVPVTDMRDVPLGTLIFRAGLLSEEQLQEALEDGTKRGKRLGEVLLERGLVSENDLGRLLAGQKGLQFVEVDPAAVDPAAVSLLSVEKARLYSVLPVGFQDGIPVVAIADPSNDLSVENVRRALACEPLFVVAGREGLHRAIELAYGAPAAPAALAPAVQPEPPAPPPAVDPVSFAPAVAQTPPVPVAPVAPPEVPAVAAAPVEPVQPEPIHVAPPAPAPVEPAPTPAPAAPSPNGDGLWLGQPAVEPLAQPLVTEPVAAPAAPVEPVPASEQLVEPPPVVEPVAAVEPAPLPAVEPLLVAPPVQPLEAQTAPAFAPEQQPEAPTQPEPAAQDDRAWTVELRLSDGERVEVGTFVSNDEAKEQARVVALHLVENTNWPFFDGRFIRPDAIVSVDLVESEHSRWLGSAVRRALNSANG